MARKARNEILYNGCYAHVFSRALEKRFIFKTEEDFQFFKFLLNRTKKKFDYRIYHYCLMSTHFHIAVSISSLDAFCQALKEIKQVYARWVHSKQGREGPVWWGRFRSQLIENESYLYACGLYIEANPFNAGIVQDPKDWLHSSCRFYSLGHPDPLIDPYEVPPAAKSCRRPQDSDFLKGNIIGSELFRLHIQERILED